MKSNNTSFERDTFKTKYFVDVDKIGMYDFPILDKVDKQFLNSAVPFNEFKSLKDKNVWVHFFIDDYQFERLWNKPTQYINLLKQAKGVITTDYSMYRDMPRAVQIYNCYRNRALARFLQTNGVNILPAVGWSDVESFAYCFDGIVKGSAVAISSNGCLKDKEARALFLKGFKKLLETINPCQVVIVGKVPEELEPKQIIKNLTSFGEKFAERRKKE